MTKASKSKKVPAKTLTPAQIKEMQKNYADALKAARSVATKYVVLAVALDGAQDAFKAISSMAASAPMEAGDPAYEILTAAGHLAAAHLDILSESVDALEAVDEF